MGAATKGGSSGQRRSRSRTTDLARVVGRDPCVLGAVSERVLVVGETLVDEVVQVDGSQVRHPGGSAANVARALARLGRPVDLWTCLGEDADGDWLARGLRADGVRLVGEPVSAERTSRARGELDAAGHASWTFDLTWTPAGVPDPGFVAVHTGSIGAVLGPGAGTVWAQLRDLPNTVLRSLDLNARPAVTGRGPQVCETVERWLSWADVVRASTEDLACYWPGTGRDRVVESWFRAERSAPERFAPPTTGFPRPGTVVLSDGAAGAVRRSRFSSEHFAAVLPPGARVVDTVGAGDTLSAALLDGLLRWRGEMEDWSPVVARAVRAAGLSVTRPGANPPTLDELDG